MRIGIRQAVALLLLLAGSGNAQVPPPAPLSAPDPAAAPPAAMSPAEVAGEVARLREALDREVARHTVDTAATKQAWIIRATSAIAAAHDITIDRPQLIVVVDRNPVVQQLRIILAQPDGPWQVVGGSRVSTGQGGRHGYFITPIGVFPHSDATVDYRALGTFNENHIRGLGLKGMRVWHFGWQMARRGWQSDGEESEMRLQMHATDPDYLERRLGRPASEGCIRIPATMNRFLDIHGVLDADYEQAAREEDPEFAAVLLPDRQPTPLAGTLLVVVDSSLVS